MKHLGALAMVVAAGLQPCGLSAGLKARGYVQEPVFRAGTIIIPLDVSVLDKNKQPVTDLKQSDFTVFENKTRQQISAFFPIKLEAEPPPAGTNPTLIRTSDAPTSLAPRKRRTFLFVFGWGRIDKPMEAIDGTIEFIREKLLPQDLVGVLLFDRLTDLTTDHRYVASVLERYREGHSAVVQAIEDFYGKSPEGSPTPNCEWCNAGEDIPDAIQKRIDAFFEVPGVPPARARARSAVQPFLQSPALKPDANPVSTHLLVDELPSRTSGSMPVTVMNLSLKPCGEDWQTTSTRWNRRLAIHDLEKMYGGIEYLRATPGEKQLIWYTNTGICDGISVQDDLRMAATAAQAHVALNIIHTKGARFSNRNFAINTAERVSEATGGQFSGVNYAKEPLAWIDASTRFGYLIGYTPTNKKMDDKFRNVTVTVNRPDVTVVYRHGYTPEKNVTPAERREKLVQARLNSGVATRASAHDIAVSARASAATGPGQRMMVTATIDAARLSWVTQGDKHVARLDVQVFCGDAKEKVIGQETLTLDLAADDETYQRYLASGIPYSARIAFSGEPFYVKVLVYDFGADLLGTTYVKLR